MFWLGQSQDNLGQISALVNLFGGDVAEFSGQLNSLPGGRLGSKIRLPEQTNPNLPVLDEATLFGISWSLDTLRTQDCES